MRKFLKKITVTIVSLGIIAYLGFQISLPFVAGSSRFSPVTINYQLSSYSQSLIDRAYRGIKNPADYHVHLLGIDGSKDTYINPDMSSFTKPINRVRYEVFMHASKIDDINLSLSQYTKRLIDLAEHMPKTKMFLYAFDTFHHQDGKEDLSKSDFYISNKLVVNMAKQHPNYFEPVISIHPNREDALEELSKWHKQGVQFVKWLPNAMNINPLDKSIKPFYEALNKYNMVLIVHAGDEHAVSSATQDYGNPLNMKPALDLGTKVVMAHGATLGTCKDLEDPTEPETACFNLFMRLMERPEYQKNLYGDISSIYLSNRNFEYVKTLLKRIDLHPRFLNGSDYPLVAINYMIHLKDFTNAGLLSDKDANALKEIFNYNPLLFDFVLSRTIRNPDTRDAFLPIVFEQRKF